MRKAIAAITPLLLVAAPAAAEMTVANFLSRADALRARGILALASSDMRLLRAEITQASSAYRADISRAKAAGSAPHSCPPDKASMSSDELIGSFRRIPAAQQASTSVRTAFYAMMKDRYPCG